MVDIMRVNVEKVLERDQKISELDKRAGKTNYSFIIFYYKIPCKGLVVRK